MRTRFKKDRLERRGRLGQFFLVSLGTCFLFSATVSAQWKMHVIDDASRGADGVRLGDIDQDGLLDIVTGWEEGGIVRVYRNPGPGKSKSRWPSVTVGKVRSPEDAVFADLNGDSRLDVVSCCEGKTRTVFVHWAPADPLKYLDSASWKTSAIEVTRNRSAWMYCFPADIDGKNGIDLVVGSKNPNGCVGWLQSPRDPTNMQDWKFHKIQTAGWIMSLEPVLPIPSTGNLNVLVSDRKGPDRGVYFLKTDRTRLNHWKRVDLLPDQNEFMFLCQSSPKQSGANQSETDPHQRIVVATRNSFILDIEVKDLKKSRLDKIPNPESIPFGKAVAIGDIDLDGEPDLVHSSNIRWLKNQRSPESGLHWLKKPANRWVSQPITDSRGKKYDRLELIDLDGDGDLDVLTCEETANLGVIWFENPVR